MNINPTANSDILLPLHPRFWDYRHGPPCAASSTVLLFGEKNLICPVRIKPLPLAQSFEDSELWSVDTLSRRPLVWTGPSCQLECCVLEKVSLSVWVVLTSSWNLGKCRVNDLPTLYDGPEMSTCFQTWWSVYTTRDGALGPQHRRKLQGMNGNVVFGWCLYAHLSELTSLECPGGLCNKTHA